VVAVDESHSTDEAHERLKEGGLKAKRRKDLADSVAALIILERYRQTLRALRHQRPLTGRHRRERRRRQERKCLVPVSRVLVPP
jgi:hypothetical protein